MVTEITSQNFSSEVTKAEGLVILDFWASWCGPCKRYGPEFEKASTELGTKAKFAKINVEEADDVAAQFGVQSIPTTIFFKEGKEVHREVGILSKEYLADAVKRLG